MNPKLIVDFDNTLVIGNSSENFEKICIKNYSVVLSCLLNFIFFSPFRYITDRFLALISKIFFERKDLRLYIFLKFFYKKEKNYYVSVFNVLARCLQKNELLYKKITSHFYIASCGLKPIIESFIEIHDLDADIIIGSTIKRNPISGILSVSQKIQYLSKLHSYIYFTDSFKEAEVLRKNYDSNCSLFIENFNGMLIYRLEVR